MVAVPTLISPIVSRSSHQLRMSPAPPPSAGIACRYAYINPAEYQVAGGQAQGAPLLAAISTSSAHAKSWGASRGLLTPWQITLPGATRWLAAPSTDQEHWPSMDGSRIWTQPAPLDGYFDPYYGLVSRAGTNPRPAFVMAASSHLELDNPVGTSFTLAITAVLHPSWNGVLAAVGTSISLTLAGDLLTVNVFGVARVSARLSHISGRAVIVVLSVDPAGGALLVVDAANTYSAYSSAPLPAGEALSMGVSGGVSVPADLLDLALYPFTLSPDGMRALAGTLDGVYGVSA